MTKYEILLPDKLICSNWWSRKWCSSISGYADFDNRLERGRAYLRKGSVTDFEIEKGCITSKVKAKMIDGCYDVRVDIAPVAPAKAARFLSRRDLLLALSNGTVPDEQAHGLFSAEHGLLPSSGEIAFACSCPDYAVLCKHVCAVLYAVASVLDVDPLVIFKLRGIDVDFNREIERMNSERLEALFGRQSGEPWILESEIDYKEAEDLFGISLSNPVFKRCKDAPDGACEPEIDRIIIKKKPPEHKKEAQRKPAARHLNPNRIIVRQFRTDGKLVAQYESAVAASSATQISDQCINLVCRGEQKTAGGFQWRRCEASAAFADIQPVSQSSTSKPKAVMMYTAEGRALCSFSSITSAAKEVRTDPKSIRNVLEGKQKTAGGYLWRLI